MSFSKLNLTVTASLLMMALGGHSASAETFYLQVSGAPLLNVSNKSVSNGGGSFTPPAVLEESGLGYDFRGTIGPVFWNKLLIGFGFNSSSISSGRDAVDGGASSIDAMTKAMSYGPAIGFLSGGFHIIGTGIVAGKQEITDRRVAFDGTVEGDFTWKNQVGLGYQIDIGYSIALSRAVKIGPSLVYRKLNYKRQSFSNTSPLADPSFDYTDQWFDTRAVEGSLTPLISVIIAL
ncbi:MAG: hypothetical protein A2X94_11570 [Bdellovibrionales bacterium GWB1_55_8]|nr:MAG: hypothetical protein A2X94_11570 [Bdellovibrionales bacterium GWB1_55_8]